MAAPHWARPETVARKRTSMNGGSLERQEQHSVQRNITRGARHRDSAHED